MLIQEALRQTIIHQISLIVAEAIQGFEYQLYGFGSFAKGAESTSSDIDIAIDADVPLPNHVFADIRDRLEESTIPYAVDVINMQTANSRLKDEIRKNGVRWNG